MTVFTLASSSSGNCTIVSQGNTHIIIDAGISLRRIRDGLHQVGLTPDDVACVLVTHEHTDHIYGLQMLMKYHKTPVFTSTGTGLAICAMLPEAGPFINGFDPGSEFGFGDIAVTSFRTPHDSSESVGYCVEAGGKKLVYATDLGCVTHEVLNAALGADIAVIEANHDVDMLKSGPYPHYLKRRVLSERGHLANIDSSELAVRLVASGTRLIQLAHLSRENNTPSLAIGSVTQALSDNRMTVGLDVELDAAPPYTPGRKYTL